LDAKVVEEKEVEDEEEEEEAEEENNCDKIQQPSPGRWGKTETQASEFVLISWSIALAFCADSGFVWVPHVPNVPNHLSIARSASSRGKGSVLGFAQWTCHGRMG